jgi:hypothetical protein
MNCIECNIEFTPIHNRGAEHKYCSNKCRNKAAVKRRENRLKSTFLSPVNNINNIENEKTRIGVSDDFAQIKENYPKQGVQEIASTGYGILSNRINTNNDTIGLLEKLYESRNETFFYKLKCEQLEKDINELMVECAKLESELDELDSEENDSQYSGMLGAVMEQFKQDPLNSVNFATEVISNLFKPKT